MNIITLAALLLIGRVISDFFISLVLIRQWKIRNIPTHPRLGNLRKVLSLLALLVFVGNIYPLVLDAITLFYPGIRTSQTVNPVGAFYAISTNLTFMFASILIWTLYKLADVAIDVGELTSGQPSKSVSIKQK